MTCEHILAAIIADFFPSMFTLQLIYIVEKMKIYYVCVVYKCSCMFPIYYSLKLKVKLIEAEADDT